MLGVNSENNFTKMKMSRDPVDGFCREASKIEIIVSVCDPESERSGKIFLAENDRD